MMKYRVIKAVNSLGETIYIPQYRVLFWWLNFSGDRTYHDKDSAIFFLRLNAPARIIGNIFEI